MAIAQNQKNKIEKTLARTLLGAGLQLTPAQLQPIQEKVSAMAEQIVEKASADAGKGGYDLPRALDRFGESAGEKAPTEAAPEEAGEQAAPRAKPTEEPETSAAPAPYQPFTEQTPAEQAAAGAGALPSKRVTAQPPADEGKAAEETAPEEAPIQERGAITQGINALRYRKELKDINKQLKQLGKKQTVLNRQIRRLKLRLAPFELAKKALQAAKAALLVIAAILFILGALLCALIVTIELGLPVIGAAFAVSRARIPLTVQIRILDTAMKPFKERLKQLEDGRRKILKQIQMLARRGIELRNAALLASAPAQTASATP